MGLEMDYIDDLTPLDEDEKGGLLFGNITPLLQFARA